MNIKWIKEIIIYESSKIIICIIYALCRFNGLYNIFVNGVDPSNFLVVSGILILIRVIANIMLLFDFRPALETLMFVPLTVVFLVFNLIGRSPTLKILLCVGLLFVNICLKYAYWNKFKYLLQK